MIDLKELVFKKTDTNFLEIYYEIIPQLKNYELKRASNYWICISNNPNLNLQNSFYFDNREFRKRECYPLVTFRYYFNDKVFEYKIGSYSISPDNCQYYVKILNLFQDYIEKHQGKYLEYLLNNFELEKYFAPFEIYDLIRERIENLKYNLRNFNDQFLLDLNLDLQYYLAKLKLDYETKKILEITTL